VAVILPSVLNTKQQAKTVLCQSNLRQLTASLLTYEMENETFPSGFETNINRPAGGFLGDLSKDRMGRWWINYISDYSNMDMYKNTIFKCPAKNLTDIYLVHNILYGNYGINYSICKSTYVRKTDWKEFTGKSLSLKNIVHPSATLLLADSGYSLITWRHVSDKDIESLSNSIGEDTAYIPGLKINSQRIDKSLWPSQEDDAIRGRHPQKTVNIGFADGHIDRKKADDLLVEKTDSGYKNRSPLWQPN
jgi:prepilin-type processing-associated H-X9-DG protein